jgi:hypothetical protein
MKNINLIATNKLSSLAYYQEGTSYNKPILQLVSTTSSDYTYQNICITNDEKIKEGDWAISIYKGLIKVSDEELKIKGYVNSFCSKIILTTDPQLIADGIQAIDDDFLEWFIKNPSCEEVEIVEGDFINGKYTFGKYHIRRMYFADEPKKEPKETLEEFIESYVNRIDRSEDGLVEKCLEDGAKWQQEGNYSEAIDLFITEIKTEFKDENWDYLEFIKERVIEQFKKK